MPTHPLTDARERAEDAYFEEVAPVGGPARRRKRRSGTPALSTEEALQQTIEELARANAELKARNCELQEFAYVASHDLQEPLRKIRAFSEILMCEHTAQLDEEGLQFLDKVQDASERMAQLISDLLALSRINTQSVRTTEVDLNRIAADVVQDLETRIDETGGRVEVEALPTIRAGATHMRQLLQNLIGNGLKFHRAGVRPVVVVSAETSTREGTDWMRLRVADNGIGFDPRFLDRVFAPFQRLHGGRRYAGSGIGLSICRRIAERLGGSITAESREGEGATFIVDLPLDQPGAFSRRGRRAE